MRVFEERAHAWSCLASLSKQQLPFNFGLETDQDMSYNCRCEPCSLHLDTKGHLVCPCPASHKEKPDRMHLHLSLFCRWASSRCSFIASCTIDAVEWIYSVTVTATDESVQQKCPFICKSEISRYESGHFKVGITSRPHFPSKHIGVTRVTLAS